LLGQAQSYSNAAQTCQALSESLWSPSKQNFGAGLNSSLAYEVYAGHYASNQLFWIAAESKHWSGPWQHHSMQHCQAMDVHGHCHDVNCEEHLPVLCTQSAPASTSTFANTSAAFQVAQSVREQTLIGYRDFYTWQFHGVRFAEEPERFTYSRVYTNATGTHSALQPAPECLQAPNNGSTDCLFLNIWTTTLPSSRQPAKQNLKPVMVYIYGGGFATGSASNPTNDGGNQASRGDVVVVDIAYRLNSLGFLAFDDGVHKGNYFLSDQIAGLQWIQNNIAAFGGDPDQVLIFGESAGAESVQALLASPEAIGLFHAAILQSNYYQPYVRVEAAYNRTTTAILAETGCSNASDVLACLQAYDTTALINLKTNFNYPVIDGTYLTSSYINLNASAAGKLSSSVPVLESVNRDEEGVLISLPGTTNLTEGIEDLAASQGYSKAEVAAILSHPNVFPLGLAPRTNNTALNRVFNTTVRIATDGGFHCSNEFTSIAAAKTGIWPKVYYAEFNRTYQDPGYDMNGVCHAPKTDSHPDGDPEQEYFKCHAGDLAISFGTFARSDFPERDAYDIPFAQLVVDYWTSFARTHDPNPDPEYLKVRGYWDTLNQIQVSGQWLSVDAEQPEMLELQWNSVMKPFPDAPQCSLLGQPLDLLLQ
jgi:carboxylesterase type B